MLVMNVQVVNGVRPRDLMDDRRQGQFMVGITNGSIFYRFSGGFITFYRVRVRRTRSVGITTQQVVQVMVVRSLCVQVLRHFIVAASCFPASIRRFQVAFWLYWSSPYRGVNRITFRVKNGGIVLPDSGLNFNRDVLVLAVW